MLQLLVRADADAEAADGAHPVLRCRCRLWVHVGACVRDCQLCRQCTQRSQTSAASHTASSGHVGARVRDCQLCRQCTQRSQAAAASHTASPGHVGACVRDCQLCRQCTQRSQTAAASHTASPGHVGACVRDCQLCRHCTQRSQTSAASHTASPGAPLSRTHSTLALPACPAGQRLGQERMRPMRHKATLCSIMTSARSLPSSTAAHEPVWGT